MHLALIVMTKHNYPVISPELALFMTVWANAMQISFNPRWMTPSGCPVGALRTQTSDNRSCVDEFGRKMLIIPDVTSNLVIYEKAPETNEYVFICRASNGEVIQDVFSIEHPCVIEVVELLQRQIRERRISSGHRYS